MILRIHFQNHHPWMLRPIHWLRLFFLTLGFVLLAISTAAYLRTALFQIVEGARLEKTLVPPAISPARSPALNRLEVRPGSVFSRLEIPRIGVSVMVIEGVRSRDLRLAVGHVPGTALPGQPGNIAIAGHRDLFFRPLRRIVPGDDVQVTTRAGEFHYRVEWTRIVAPADVSVLRSSGEPALTLVTCYPFYYVGTAPKRFIVRARLQTP